VLDGRAYRTFHDKQCYQLSIRWVMTNEAVFDSDVKKLMAEDSNKVNRALEWARDSFGL
jgi:hypothetical protein